MAFSASSSLATLPPFRVEPRFDVRVWGFMDLRPWYDKVADRDPLGEVWLTGDECVVATGPCAGKKLASVYAEQPRIMLGKASPDNASPLLIKVILAREKLSVQVHPDDRMAQKYGDPRGKTECWYVLAADPGAQVAAGLNPGVTLKQIRDEIQAGNLEQSLQRVDVAAGDLVFEAATPTIKLTLAKR